MAADETVNHEYLPILGLESFSNAAPKMVLGDDSIAIKEGRVRLHVFYIRVYWCKSIFFICIHVYVIIL